MGHAAVSGLHVCASLEWSYGLRASRHQKSSVYNLLTQTAHGCYCLYALTHPDGNFSTVVDSALAEF